jgi:hypothetical protein
VQARQLAQQSEAFWQPETQDAHQASLLRQSLFPKRFLPIIRVPRLKIL